MAAAAFQTASLLVLRWARTKPPRKAAAAMVGGPTYPGFDRVESMNTYVPLDRRSTRPVRDPRAHRRGRHGRGVQGARHAARSCGGRQDLRRAVQRAFR